MVSIQVRYKNSADVLFLLEVAANFGLYDLLPVQ